MKNKIFITAKEVAEVLGICKTSAYKMIQEWNKQLQAKGYTTISGRVSRKYFEEQFYGMNEKEVR